MKKISLNYILLSLILFFASFKYILNGCKYSENFTSDAKYTNETNYLGQLTGDQAKIQCFILSNTIHEEGLCCYNRTSNECVSKNQNETEKNEKDENSNDNGDSDKNNGIRRIEENNNENNLECPKTITDIFNNCGTAGLYQPESKEVCQEISLVQGYCCFVELSNNETACIRTKNLNKDKNSETKEIKSYIDAYNKGLTIKSVNCNSSFLQFFWLLLILTLMII